MYGFVVCMFDKITIIFNSYQMLDDWSFDYLAANGDYLDMLNFVLDRKFNISDMSKEELMEAVRNIV